MEPWSELEIGHRINSLDLDTGWLLRHPNITSAFFFWSEAFLLAIEIATLFCFFFFPIWICLYVKLAVWIQAQHLLFVPLTFTLLFAAQRIKIMLDLGFVIHPVYYLSTSLRAQFAVRTTGVVELLLKASWDHCLGGMQLSAQSWQTWVGSTPKVALEASEGKSFAEWGKELRGKVFDESKFYFFFSTDLSRA